MLEAFELSSRESLENLPLKAVEHPSSLFVISIGVNGASGGDALLYADADARRFDEQFPYASKHKLMTSTEETTRSKVLESVSDVTEKAGDTDRILVFMSLHGALETRGDELYFMTSGADRDNIVSTGLWWGELRSVLLRSQAKSVIVFIDACYSGAAAQIMDESTRWPDRRLAVMTSSSRLESSQEKAALKAGVFTSALIDSIAAPSTDANRDGQLSIGEIAESVKPAVIRKSRHNQHLQYTGDPSLIVIERRLAK